MTPDATFLESFMPNFKVIRDIFSNSISSCILSLCFRFKALELNCRWGGGRSLVLCCMKWNYQCSFITDALADCTFKHCPCFPFLNFFKCTDSCNNRIQEHTIKFQRCNFKKERLLTHLECCRSFRSLHVRTVAKQADEVLISLCFLTLLAPKRAYWNSLVLM